MMPNDLCSICQSRKQQQEVSVSETVGTSTLWEFPFLQYHRFDEMKQALNLYYNSYENSDPRTFWCLHNEDGYTFTQWQIYFLSKKYYRYRGMRGPVFTLFNVLATFPFFTDLLLLGTRQDPTHHTLHHFLFHMECGINHIQTRMYFFLVKSLQQHGHLHRIHTKDGRNCSVIDYYNKLLLPQHVVNKCNSLTEAYKKTENELFEHLHFLSKCRQCSSYLRPYQELVEQHIHLFEFLDQYPEWSEKIHEMLQSRDECNQLYGTYVKNEGDLESIKRHDYVIQVYRTLFEW